MRKTPPMQNNVGLFLTKRAFRDPHLEAMVESAGGRRFTYKEMNDRCNRTAHALTSLGVRHGDRVGVLLMNGIEFLETFFAAGKIGAVCVPLNWRLVAEELDFILNDSGTTVLVFGSEFASLAEELHERDTKVEQWVQVAG